MTDAKIIWIASFPRSGNTFLRTILWHCFGLRSASIYTGDLGGNRKLEEYVGHLESGPDNTIRFPENAVPLVKTHEHPRDDNPAIYVIRDGRAATVSLWKFYKGIYPIEPMIEGKNLLGTWSNHVESWKPWKRPNTLLLRYEDMKDNLPVVLNALSRYLKRAILKDCIPDRATIASVDGRWVLGESDWKTVLSGDLLERFNQINGSSLRRAGYL